MARGQPDCTVCQLFDLLVRRHGETLFTTEPLVDNAGYPRPSFVPFLFSICNSTYTAIVSWRSSLLPPFLLLFLFLFLYIYIGILIYICRNINKYLCIDLLYEYMYVWISLFLSFYLYHRLLLNRSPLFSLYRLFAILFLPFVRLSHQRDSLRGSLRYQRCYHYHKLVEERLKVHQEETRPG